MVGARFLSQLSCNRAKIAIIPAATVGIPMSTSKNRSLDRLPAAEGSCSPEPDIITLHVCTSCRTAGTPREPRERRPGYILYQQLVKALDASPLGHRVHVRPAECLSVCPRPCGIALSLPGAWTYLFGDQRPGETSDDLLKCVALYLQSPEGFMARTSRPSSLRSSILGRVPPSRVGLPCT